MIINTSSTKEGYSTVAQAIDLKEYNNDIPPLEKLFECTAAINRIQGTLYIQVHYDGIVRMQCARCLETYNQSLVGDCRLIIQERPGCFGPAEEDEATDYYFDTEHTLVDISGFIFDEIMTSLPMMPLCDSDCKGISMSNANPEDEQNTYDPRWEALRKLKKR